MQTKLKPFLKMHEAYELLTWMTPRESSFVPVTLSTRCVEDDQKLFMVAETNDVASLVAHGLANEYGWYQVTEHWRMAHQTVLTRISSYLAELDVLADRFQQHGIPLVALKNGGIARGIYPCPGCCPMGDLDVLVEKHHFRTAHYLLLEFGYRFEFRSPLEEADLQTAEENGSAEYYKILTTGEKMWLELQWRPVAGRWIRPDQEPTATELMTRSISIPGTAVRLLMPEDNLLQVSLHTAKHSYVRAPGLRLHTDVDRIVRLQSINWSIFVERVQHLSVKTAVYFSLAIPHALFDTPIPNEVLQTLKPPRWKQHLLNRWIRHAGLFDPDSKKFSRFGYIIFAILLYDDLKGFWRSLFPNPQWMQARYGFRQNWLLPYYYLRRLLDLTFQRVST